MANWGKCDYKQLQQLRNNLEKLSSVDMDKFCRDMSKELAARLLALVIPATPVGQYPKESGKKSGTLRRGWTGKSSGGSASAYAESVEVVKHGCDYTVQIINPVYYASYVEFGHRTPNGKGWVRGQYFLSISEQELKENAPIWIEKRLQKLLKEAFNV